MVTAGPRSAVGGCGDAPRSWPVSRSP